MASIGWPQVFWFAALASVIGVLILLLNEFEKRRRPKVKLVPDTKTQGCRVEIRNRASRPLQVKEVGLLVGNRARLPIKRDFWSCGDQVEARGSLDATADMEVILRLGHQCRKLGGGSSVDVRGYCESALEERRQSKPVAFVSPTGWVVD